MNEVNALVPTLLGFVRTNYIEIIVIFVIVAIGILIYTIATNSLSRMKTGILEYYPFDIFFPHSGEWSIGTFLLVILCVGLLIIFLAKGNFYPGPA